MDEQSWRCVWKSFERWYNRQADRLTDSQATEAGLLAAICDRPEDDQPRLAYADWLDERAGTVQCDECVDGDVGCPTCQGAGIYYDPPYSLNRLKCPKCNDGLLPDKCKKCGGTGRVSNGFAERAEFIRVQCELARVTAEANAISVDVRRVQEGPALLARKRALRRRERELWGMLRKGFAAADCYLDSDNPTPLRQDHQPFGIIRRGFVAELRCPMAAFMGGPCRCAGEADGVPECMQCDGTGRTPGLAAELAHLPLETIRLTDREPSRFGRVGTPGPDDFRGKDTHFWITTSDPAIQGGPNRLPAEFREHLGGYIRDCGPVPRYDVIGHYFDTAAAAHAALSRAAVAYVAGRRT